MSSRESLVDQVASSLTAEIADAFRRFAASPQQETKALSAQLDEYASDVKDLAEQEAFSDPDYALELIERCRALLSQAKDDDAHTAIQAATLYLIDCDDASSDADSLVGMEDDAQVIKAVEQALAARRG